jgi:type IV secretion system protein TrbI
MIHKSLTKRIIFPNGESIDLQGMPGMDRQGYAGFNGNVNNHYLRLFGSAILMSIIGTSAQLAVPTSDNVLTPPNSTTSLSTKS